MRTKAPFRFLWLALFLGGQMPGALAQDAPPSSGGRTTAEIRIGLPEGVEPDVRVTPGEGRIILELPFGSTFPRDFEAASGGFLSGADVVRLGEDRLRLELHLAQGLLDRVEFTTGSVNLYFQSRFGLLGAGGGEDQYRLGPGDKIRVTVHNQPDLTSKLTITDAGTITASLIGEVQAAGLTVRQLGMRLAELLDRHFLVTPQVDVQVEEYQSQWVMVAGEVRSPGRIALRGGTHLKEALTRAEGFNPEAGERISIARLVNGSPDPMTIDVDREAFERGMDNPPLQHGDIITVEPAAYCYVQGEVETPNRVRIERGMTLLKAITMVGDLTDWANQKSVRILREGEDGPGQEYNLKAIRNGKAEDPQLKGGDVIIVKRRFL